MLITELLVVQIGVIEMVTVVLSTSVQIQMEVSSVTVISSTIPLL